jgi:Mce-associated membrane protein
VSSSTPGATDVLTAGTDAPAAGSDVGPEAASFPRLLVGLLTAAAVLLVVASVVLALVVHSHRVARSDLAQAREAALVASRQAILDLDALSADTIDADLARVVADATGTFKEQFTKSQATLKQLVVSRKTSSSGVIRAAAVVRSDTDTASVLVAVDRTVVDSTNKDGVVQNDRWKVSLEKHEGHWLVSDLAAVS